MWNVEDKLRDDPAWSRETTYWLVGLLAFVVSSAAIVFGHHCHSTQPAAERRVGVVESPTAASGTGGDAAPLLSEQDARADILERRLRSPERVKKLQLALKRAGFNPGDVDGQFSPQTKSALIAFQRSSDLEPDGVDGTKTWVVLNHYADRDVNH